MGTDFLLSAWPFVIGLAIGILVLIYLIVAAIEWVATKNTEAFIKRMHKENEESHARIMEQVQQYRAARKSYQSSSFSPSSSRSQSTGDSSNLVNDAMNYAYFYDPSGGSSTFDTGGCSSSSDSSSSSSSDSSSSSCGSSGGD